MSDAGYGLIAQTRSGVQVPSALITALIGLVIVFVVSSDIFVRRRARRRVSASVSDTALAAETEAGP